MNLFDNFIIKAKNLNFLQRFCKKEKWAPMLFYFITLGKALNYLLGLISYYGYFQMVFGNLETISEQNGKENLISGEYFSFKQSK